MTDRERFPLLDSFLAARGLPRQAIYTIKTTAAIFDVSTRTIQDWCCNGKLVARNLPGRGKFLNSDLESFLQKSLRPPESSNGAAGRR